MESTFKQATCNILQLRRDASHIKIKVKSEMQGYECHLKNVVFLKNNNEA